MITKKIRMPTEGSVTKEFAKRFSERKADRVLTFTEARSIFMLRLSTT